ncbi:helix-turn-helix domain-containing protein [Nocardioides sp. DS6]|uniref:Helix-turn-helix domain-containing protein n=1 Tax=Nocardioides eburneus TaxID=3231482 RepID=A0ABV3SWX1_9ACTN
MGYEIVTQDGLRRLRSARETFLAAQPLPADFPAWLAAAWRRSLFLGLEVGRAEVPHVPVTPDPVLVRAAAPVLEHLASTLAGLHAAVVLSDRRARIIGRWTAEDRSRTHLDAIGTRAGADLSEPATGTNGISHVLATRRPTVIGGPEHLFDLYQQTVCAGAPVQGPLSSRPVGAIAVIGRLDAAPAVLQALAATAAAAVERELLHQASARERSLLDVFLRASPDGAPVAVLDGRTRLVSDAAAQLLRPADLDALEVWVRAAAGEVELGDGTRVLLSPALGADDPGVLARVLPAPAEARRVHRRHPPGVLRRAGLAGGSALWQALERAVSRSGDRPLLLVGEAGVGKAAIAAALQPGARMVDGSAPDATAALESLGDDDRLVLRRLDRISDAARALAVLDRFGGRAVATYTTSGPAPSYGDWTPYVVRVPSLRERTEDLGDIATALGAPLSVAALAVLRRHSWPGNVTELAAVLRWARAEAAGAPIAPRHLPPELVVPEAGPRLSELERAERATIAEALRTTDGNKVRAAELLGIARATLYRKLRRYRLT